MLVCHCNVIAEKEIEDIVRSFLRDDPWAILVPAKIYHELGKRGRCCGCFPNVVDIITRVTQDWHRENAGDAADLKIVQVRLDAMRRKHHGGRRERRSTGHRAA